MNRLLSARTCRLPPDTDRDDADGPDGDTWIDLPSLPGTPAEPHVRADEEPAPDWIPL